MGSSWAFFIQYTYRRCAARTSRQRRSYRDRAPQVERLVWGVAGQLDVAESRDWSATMRCRDDGLPLPVDHPGRRSRVQLLVRERRRDRHYQLLAGNRHRPARRVCRASFRARPLAVGRNNEIAITEHRERAVGADDRAVNAEWRTLGIADQVKHRIRSVLELDREPVPPALLVGH